MDRFEIYISSSGVPRYINVYVVEIDEVKAVTEILKTGNARIKTIRSPLIKNRWFIAEHVYDGSTPRAQGYRARQEAAELIEKLKQRAQPKGD